MFIIINFNKMEN